MATKSQKEKLLEYAESPWVITALAVIGGIVGFFFYAPVLILCGVAFILEFHRKKVVSGRPVWRVQVPAYVVLTVVVVGGLYWLHLKLDNKLAEGNTTLAKLVGDYVVKNTPKPTANSRAFMQILKMQGPQKLEANKETQVNIYLTNGGDEPAYDTHSKFGVASWDIPNPEDERQASAIDGKMHDAFLKQALAEYKKGLANGEHGTVVPPGGQTWNTVSFFLSQKDLEEITSGHRRLYFYAWSRWKDNKEDYEYCVYLPPGAITFSENMAWHNC